MPVMIRVLIVDDSTVYRILLANALKELPDIEVVGSVCDGQQAIEKMSEFKPDVVTLDMNMPRMNGMETLAILAVKFPAVQVIVVAAETRNDAERVIAVLEAGAFEMVVKPKAMDANPQQSLRQQLYPVIKAAAKRKMVVSATTAAISKKVQAATATRSLGRVCPDIVVIGSSTGGPAALYEVLSQMGKGFPLPIVVVQHMPKLFIETLAARLNRETALTCLVAQENMTLKPGHVYFAPGETHLDIIRTAGGELSTLYNDDPPEHHCKPAVDVTLRSLRKLAQLVKTVVVILTGMGRDGASEAKQLSDLGAKVIAQDEQSSVVWGMPGETVKLGAADEVVPLDQISAAIYRKAGLIAP